MYVTFSVISDSSPAYVWWFSRIYLYSFVSLFIYVVLNLFIAVILDTYEMIKVVPMPMTSCGCVTSCVVVTSYHVNRGMGVVSLSCLSHCL